MAGRLVRDVVERHNDPGSSAPSQGFTIHSSGSSKTGFPTVQHRSKATSAFKRARRDERTQSGLSASRDGLESAFKPESATDSSASKVTAKSARVADEWTDDISQSNEYVVARMSADERIREREDIVDKFGPGIHDLIAKVREARERRTASQTISVAHGQAQSNQGSTVTSAQNSTPPSPRTRAARKIRFVEPTEADVHVYESQPSSPKRVLAMLPPPPANSQERRGISSLGTFKGSMQLQEPHEAEEAKKSPPNSPTCEDTDPQPPEEGTPEDIRRRFFPSELPPEDNPSLAWMLPSSASSVKSSLSDSDLYPTQGLDVNLAAGPRYSLSGTRLTPSQISGLPTHLGLHHHASTPSTSSSDAPAGYTLSDLLLLARSSVPAQRASILGVLANILRLTCEQKYMPRRNSTLSALSDLQEGSHDAPAYEQNVNLDTMRGDMLDAAIDALGEKGGVGQRAVDVLWEVVVGCTQMELDVTDLDDFARVDFTPPSPLPSSPTALSPKAGLQPASTSSSSSHSSVTILTCLPLIRLLPALRYHLISSPSPLSRTHAQVLDILLVLSHFSHHAQTIASPNEGAGVIVAMLGPHLESSSRSSDIDNKEQAYSTPASIRILQALACSNRDNASKLIGPADVLLRHIATSLPSPGPEPPQFDESHSDSRLTLSLLEETLRLYMLLSQYGLYAQVATIAQDHFKRIGSWLLDAQRTISDPALASLSRAYLCLLQTWIVCATDPHRTTPSHDILWSQIQGWGWAEWIMDFAELLDSASEPLSPSHFASLGVQVETIDPIEGVWTDVCHAVAAWVEGASVNGVKGGEGERVLALKRLGPIFETGHRAWRSVRAAVAALQTWEFPTSVNAQTMNTFRRLAQAADLVAATLRLALACFGPEVEDQPFDLPVEDIHKLCQQFLDDVSPGPFDLVSGARNNVPEYAHTFLRPVSLLLVRHLQFWLRLISLPISSLPTHSQEVEWAAQASHVLTVLLPGDETYTKWVMGALCNNIQPNFIRKILPAIDTPREMWDKEGMKILLPFLTNSLQPTTRHPAEDGSRTQITSIAPLSPTPESIAQCTTLKLPSLSHLEVLKSNGDLVLPLRSDWPTLPLNHLLRSGTSPVFHALPASWDASETDVVRASLLLARIVQNLEGKGDSNTRRHVGMSRAEAIFACMKVFMLEHGQQQDDSGDEVFRDSWTTRWMEDLLKPFSYSSAMKSSVQESGSSLEHVSKSFLGVGTPFYQFYTDFLTLYDAISFSHTLFGRLLLPPVSMSYPIDYRKLLFGDFSHVLRTVRTGVQDAICEDVREYLWPVEHDAHIIGWYLQALVTSHVEGFLRWIAVHHVAANIWPEFAGAGGSSHERAGKLLSAVLQRGSKEIVRDVALYRQVNDEVWEPPKCFITGERAWRQRRLEWVERIGGEGTMELLQSLFLD